jgi:hypothetical protein
MPRFISRRLPSPDLAFAALLTAVWLLVVLEVSFGVVAPLARTGLV